MAYINQYGDSIRSAAFFFISRGKTADQVIEKLSGVLKESNDKRPILEVTLELIFSMEM